ncbi:hypothetical protein ACOMHN_029913 [Nucella lapillus]
MNNCHRSQSTLVFPALQGNITVSGDGKEFMDVTGNLVCDIVVVAPEKHVLYVYLRQWDYECDYYFSDLFLVYDSNTGPMDSLLPYQLCVTPGSRVYSHTNNVTLRFIWEPTGYAFRFVVDFRAEVKSDPRTPAVSPGYSSPGPSVTKEAEVRPGSPVLLDNGQWNCSLTPLSEIMALFPCNVRAECVGGEDEAVCFYSAAQCGAGSIAAGGSCFRLVRPQVSSTWQAGSAECQRRGGHLAVVNSRQEWADLYQVLLRAHHDHDYNIMAIGMRLAPVSVSPLYRQLYQWVDQTIAYDIGTTGSYNQPKGANCGFLFLSHSYLYQNYRFLLMFLECDLPNTRYYLCETPLKKSSPKSKFADPETSKIIMPVPANFNVSISTVICPSGYLTHEFLACDVNALCFTSKDRRLFSCSAPLTPLPPMFTCANGLERVPYTSVCDHRPDCFDDSDENVCIFRACDPMEEEQCGNRECKPRHLWCDFSADCVNGADEQRCNHHGTARMRPPTLRPPAIVDFKMVDRVLTESLSSQR